MLVKLFTYIYFLSTKLYHIMSTRRSKSLAKNIYLSHRRYLTMHHPYRRLKRSFDEERNAKVPRRYCFHTIFCGLQNKEKIGC